MRTTYCLLFLFAFSIISLAEGTREVSPTGNICALYIGSNTYGQFARYNDTTSSNLRLNIHIIDPSKEAIQLGFSNAITAMLEPTQYKFFVKDPNGAVVYESDVIREVGQIENWSQGFEGPKILSPLGYDQITLSPIDLMSQGWIGEGDYYVEFLDVEIDRAFLILYWDITVTSFGVGQIQEFKGRAWSKNWVLFTPTDDPENHFTNEFEGGFYIVAPDENKPGTAFISRMNFEDSEFFGAAFAIALNDFGTQKTGSAIENRRSISFENTVVGQYPIFLNDPIEIYATADLGTVQFIGSEGCLPDNYCIYFESGVSGEIEVLLDFFGNNLVYDHNTADILLVVQVAPDEINTPICLPWNGLNGHGRLYEGKDLDLLDIKISFRQGLFHFPVYDVEINGRGFNLQRVRPAGQAPLLYYDDGDIPFLSTTMSPNIELNGCAPPCHSWSGSTLSHSYGNFNTINSWWYSVQSESTGTIELRYNKESKEIHSLCAGTSYTYLDSTIRTDGQHKFYYQSLVGCDSTHIVHINIIDYESVITSEQTTLNCDHPTITLNGNLSLPQGSIDFIWNGPPGSEINNTFTNKIDVTTPGIYSLKIIEQSIGCTDEVAITIDEDKLFPEIDILEVPTFKCKFDEKTIVVDVSDSVYEPIVSWTTQVGIINDITDPLMIGILSPGQYIISVHFDENGCETSELIDVIRDSSSYLDITGATNLLAGFCTKPVFNLEINEYDQVIFNWSPDSLLSCTDCLNPTLNAVGEYNYLLTASDSNNCKVRHNVNVDLSEDYKIYIPNAFSPNNDGINDHFHLFSSPCAVQVEEFAVLNRWGDRVFKRTDFLSTDNQASWNGFVGDEAAEVGVYAYFALLKLHDGTSAVLNGDVQIVK